MDANEEEEEDEFIKYFFLLVGNKCGNFIFRFFNY